MRLRLFDYLQGYDGRGFVRDLLAGITVATLMAGVMLITMGALRLGTLIKYIPYPVIAGFTSGIAVIIFEGQLRELLGLRVALPVNALLQLGVLVRHVQETQWHALGV